MITQTDLREAVSVLTVMMQALLGSLDVTNAQAVNARYSALDLIENAEYLIRDQALGEPLAQAFDLAYAAGITVVGLEGVRTAVTALVPTGLCAQIVAVAGVRLCLCEEIKVYVASKFESRQDVDGAINQIRGAFEQAIEFAADNSQPDIYQGLIRAQGAIIAHFNETARPLPSLVSYSVGRTLTSHALAQRLYADASRCDQLRSENKIAYPGAMPQSGSALSQ